jgi:hypothetical protein
MSRTTRLRWQPIVATAREIVESYDTLVTLRQLFYRLVAQALLPNTLTAYKSLSAKTAEARRDDDFPDLMDTTRGLERPESFTSPQTAQDWLRSTYRRDRTEFQDVSIYLGVEKRTLVAQLESWFGDYGIPVLALGGYASQTFVDEVAHDVHERSGIERHTAMLAQRILAKRGKNIQRDLPKVRDAVLLYAGDFDPSGEDIDRDFVERVGIFSEVVRVALTPEQVVEYELPPQPGKATDSRADGFIARHGELVQVELEALDPNILRGLYQDALAGFWDVSAFERSLARESADLEVLPSGDDLGGDDA